MRKSTRVLERGAAIGLAALLSRVPALRAIEIPLEGAESKSTVVGTVNMHKIFEAFPETETARTAMTEMIESIRADITSKKEEIANLKGEIEFLKKQKSAVAPETPDAGRPEELRQGATELAELTEAEAAAAQPPEPTTRLTLPEDHPLGFLFSPPPGEGAEGAPEPSSAVYSTFSAAIPEILPGVPSPLPELEVKEALLRQKEADLEAYVGAAEEEVKRIQEGKTMTLMARIYRSLEDIAVKEGYSIIVDKDTILYGDGASDVTQNVIWRLSSPLP